MTSIKAPAPPAPDDRPDSDEVLAAARHAFADTQHADPVILDGLLSAALLPHGSLSASKTIFGQPIHAHAWSALSREPGGIADYEEFRTTAGKIQAVLNRSLRDRPTSYRLVAELAERFSDLRDALSAVACEEASASQVRANWAHYLDIAGEEERPVYVTRDGKRFAALVPAHVAEAYASENEWFGTAQWQEKMREADSQYEAGQATVYLNDDEFDAALAEEDAI